MKIPLFSVGDTVAIKRNARHMFLKKNRDRLGTVMHYNVKCKTVSVRWDGIKSWQIYSPSLFRLVLKAKDVIIGGPR